MKVALVVLGWLLLGGITASAAHAQQSQPNAARTAVKPAPVHFVPATLPRRGSIGGPVSKGAKINGTGIRPKH